MDTATLISAMGNNPYVPYDRYAALTPAFNAAMLQAECTTVDRAAMWCAQIGHESGGLRYMQEIASGDAYDTRTDLGNTPQVDGDGRRYKGHGPIQITGKYNHARVSEWAHANGYVPTPTYFVDFPDELAGDRYGFLGAVWYWTVARPMNRYADARDIDGATRAVNGGTNGLDDRRARWEHCLRIGPAILPTPTRGNESMPEIPELVHDQLSGHEGRGWPILGKSKVDPDRDNTVVEALAEVRDALLSVQPSLVEPQYLAGAEPAKLDAATFARTADYQAFHAARVAQETAAAVEALTTQFAKLAETVAALHREIVK